MKLFDIRNVFSSRNDVDERLQYLSVFYSLELNVYMYYCHMESPSTVSSNDLLDTRLHSGYFHISKSIYSTVVYFPRQ